MKIRLMGTREECEIYAEALRQNAGPLILEISAFYPNRGGGKLGRVYIETREINETNAGKLYGAKAIKGGPGNGEN